MYPILWMDKEMIRSNIEVVAGLCASRGIRLAGVVKGCNAQIPFLDALASSSVSHIASSRLVHLETVRSLYPEKTTMLLRIPMVSELDRLVRSCDISLHSELEVLEILEKTCSGQGVKHRVILMLDVGDLREGFFNENELIQTAIKIENGSGNLFLEGIGTNVGCYGSIKATPENLGRLCFVAGNIERSIGRKLDIISGGGTSSLPLLGSDLMPLCINHLRIGEGFLTCRDLGRYFGFEISGTSKEAFIVEAEIIEVKVKPTHPIGEMGCDAFGNKPEYEDRGVQKRVILALGKQDFGDHEKLVPMKPGIRIVGSSSDHLIVECEGDNKDLKVGKTMKFGVFYPALLFLTGSPYVTKRLKSGPPV